MPRDIVDNQDAERVLRELRLEAAQLDTKSTAEYTGAEHLERLLEWLEMRFPAPTPCHVYAQQVVKHMRKLARGRGYMSDVVDALEKFEIELGGNLRALHIARPNTVEGFQKLAAEYGPWHEPDEQDVSGRVSSGGLGTAGISTIEATLVVYKEGLPVFEVGVTDLIEWAAWPPKAPAGDDQ